MRGAILDHRERKAPRVRSDGDPRLTRLVTAHVQAHIGPIDWVFHDLKSDVIHLDLLWAGPGPDRPFQTVVTCGMSERAMRPPDWAGECRHAELVLRLPPDWGLGPGRMQDERDVWPYQELEFLGRAPHIYETWFWEGHTVANCDPPEPLCGSIGFCGSILTPVTWTPQEFRELETDPDRTVRFMSAIPLHADELQLARDAGAEVLLSMLARAGVTDLLDPDRESVAGTTN